MVWDVFDTSMVEQALKIAHLAGQMCSCGSSEFMVTLLSKSKMARLVLGAKHIYESAMGHVNRCKMFAVIAGAHEQMPSRYCCVLLPHGMLLLLLNADINLKPYQLPITSIMYTGNVLGP
jgi:hypothetical protein